MKVFLIILAVLVLLLIIILSLSAEFTIIFDNGWSTKVKVLFIEKDIKLSQLLSFILFPDKAGEQAAANAKKSEDLPSDGETEIVTEDKVSEKPEEKVTEITISDENGNTVSDLTEEQKAVIQEIVEERSSHQKETEEPEKAKEGKPSKSNPIKKIIDEDGVVGILLFASNLLQTVNSAVTTLIKGLHIYSLYVKMIIGGGDAADIGEKFGAVCGWYYPLKGIILNQMKVDQYDDYIQPDFIAPRSEYEFQFIGSLSVGLLVKMLLKAAKVFLVNYFKNK